MWMESLQWRWGLQQRCSGGKLGCSTGYMRCIVVAKNQSCWSFVWWGLDVGAWCVPGGSVGSLWSLGETAGEIVKLMAQSGWGNDTD